MNVPFKFNRTYTEIANLLILPFEKTNSICFDYYTTIRLNALRFQRQNKLIVSVDKHYRHY